MGVEQPRVENVLAHLRFQVVHLTILARDECVTSDVVGFLPAQILLLGLIPFNTTSSSKVAPIVRFALSLLLLKGLLLLLHSKHVHKLIKRDPFHGGNLRHRRVILIKVSHHAFAEH